MANRLHALAGRSTPMANPYRRRALAWLLHLATWPILPAVCLLVPVLIVRLLGGEIPPGVSAVVITSGFAILGIFATVWATIWLLSRPGCPLEGYTGKERRVMYTWLLKGDPLGRKLGRTHCHTCNHVRGASVICPECGSNRLDPTE